MVSAVVPVEDVVGDARVMAPAGRREDEDARLTFPVLDD